MHTARRGSSSMPSRFDADVWWHFRRPALLGPAVGFLAFLASEAATANAPASTDGLIALPVVLILATVFGAIPCLLGGVLLIVACRALPPGLVRYFLCRLALGGAIGALIAWPFSWLVNGMIPYGSMLIGCAVAGAYCAAFMSQSRPEALPS